MKFEDKNVLFDEFLKKWGLAFDKLPHFLEYLCSYPEIVDLLGGFQIKKLGDLRKSQTDWLSLLANLENPIDTRFFKDYWVPIHTADSDFYIDISTQSFSIFEVGYFFYEPYCWFKLPLIEDVDFLLKKIDDPYFSITGYSQFMQSLQMKAQFSGWPERDRLGFAGKLKDERRKGLGWIISDDDAESHCILKTDSVLFTGINARIVAVFPRHLEIFLETFESNAQRDATFLSGIRNTNALMYLSDRDGPRSIQSFTFYSLIHPEFDAEYKDYTLEVRSKDQQFLSILAANYEQIKKG